MTAPIRFLPSSRLLAAAPALLLGAVISLAACSTQPTQSTPTALPPKYGTVAPDAGEPLTDGAVSRSARAAAIYPGSGEFFGKPAEHLATIISNDRGISLNFVDADLRTVIGSVLGESLGLSYTVDPAIKGTVTLQSAKPLRKDDLLAALEATLRLQDIAMINRDGSYSIVPAHDVQRQVPPLRTPDGVQAAGFGVDVIPLRYTGAVEMQKLLMPFAPAGMIQFDETRNLLFVSGTRQERAQLGEIVEMFDVDWLAGMSYATYPVEYADAKTITDEIKEIILEPKSPLTGVVRLIPLSRINTILVASPQASYLKQIGDWIKRLDLGNSSPGRRIYVYDVQNGRASDLSETLGEIFGIGGGASARSSDATAGLRGTPSGTAYGGNNSSGLGAGNLGVSINAPLASVSSSQSRRSRLEGSSSGQSAGGASFGDVEGLRIVPSEENNSILVLATPSEFGIIESALKRLDITPRQVLIESSVAEVTLNNQLQYGVQWSLLSGKNSLSLSQSSSGAILSQFPGLNYVFASGTAIEAVLSALDSLTKVKVISSPKLLVLNNHQAEINVGDQVPILTQQAVGVGQAGAPIVNSVAQQNTGVTLHITPRVNKTGTVILDIDQEVSAVTPTTSSNINSPTIRQRRISTTVSVRDGETIVLGGLISDSVTKGSSGVPWLSRIPVFGALFGQINNATVRTELIVLLKPRVVQNETETTNLMNDLRNQFKAVIPFQKWER